MSINGAELSLRQLAQDGVGRLDAGVIGIVAVGQHDDADALGGHEGHIGAEAVVAPVLL